MATLYAEILMNIQQATVTATIPGYSIVPQKAWMSDDRRVFYFSHDGKPISVSLPCEIVENVNISSELSTWRLPLKKNCSIHLSTDPNGDPWAASSLTKDTLIACGYCNTPILSESPIWKDLPSESWAEMMDFWHCHKPETKELGKSQPSGYSAGESIKCSSGVAFVDERHIIMARADCNLHVGAYISASTISTSSSTLGSKKEACSFLAFISWQLTDTNVQDRRMHRQLEGLIMSNDCPPLSMFRGTSFIARHESWSLQDSMWHS